jgi:SAM-dependent methyltransferase
MSGGAHGFTSVDDQSDPDAWVRLLDRLGEEPFYAAYKARVLELLAPVAGGRYLDVGGGTGAAARSLREVVRRESVGAEALAVVLDRSVAMARAASRRETGAVAGQAEALPFADASFDGAWADRTVQHLADPGRALAELVRVTRPGGRLVVVDPDYDTQVVDVEDQELARRVLRFRADHLLRNGTIAHRVPGLLNELGVDDPRVEPATLVVRDPTAVDNVMGLWTWAATAHDRGLLSAEEANAWPVQLDQAVASGRFLYAVTFFITAGTRGRASAG